MTSIDYSEIKIVGVVHPKPNSRHASVRVLGYLNNSWDFSPLSSSDTKEIFPSRGNVFAPGFQDKYKKLIGKCVFMGVMPSNNDGADEYVWDRENGHPDEYGIVISNGIGLKIGTTPDEIYDYLNQEGYFERTTKSYLKFGNKIYVISPEELKRFYIREIDFTTIPQKAMTYDGYHYVFMGGEEIPIGTSKPIDVMPDSLLREWIVKEFLTKEWASLGKPGVSPSLISSIIQLVNSTKLPKPVLLSRKSRAASVIGLFEFSYLEMLDFAKNPILREVINESISANCEQFIEKEKGELQEKLYQIRCSFEQQIKQEQQDAASQIRKIKENIEYEKLSFDIVNEELQQKKQQVQDSVASLLQEIEQNHKVIEKQENRLKEIAAEKDHLINSFGIIKEVMTSVKDSAKNNNLNNAESYSNQRNTKTISYLNAESEEIKLQQTFLNRLEFYLAKNNRDSSLSKKLFGYLIHYKVLLLPDSRVLQSIIKASGQCYYNIEYVTPEWRSFDCVWNNGLSQIIDSCVDKPEIIHYYILQNINMSYIPCFLQPIVDMIIGLAEHFPKSNISFPENLRILMTATEEDGLPLAAQSIKYFGCLKKEDYTIDLKNEIIFSSQKCEKRGYITHHLFKELSYTSPLASEYLSYLQENE